MNKLAAALFVVVLAFTGTMRAQIIDPPGSVALTAAGADCTTAGACAVFDISAAPSVNIQVAGTFTATVTFEATADGGNNWVAVLAGNLATGAASTTATSGGIYALTNSGFSQVRARVSAYTSGTVRVVVNRGRATARVSPTFQSSLVVNGSTAINSSLTFFPNQITFNSTRSIITSPSDGQLLMTNNASNDFSRLMFGGTTSSFPALKRNTTRLDVRLADDSGFANFAVSTLILGSGSNLNSSVDGVIQLYNGAQNDFTRLNFGGTSASFPALKRVGVSLQARLADDSANTSFGIASLAYSATLFANLGTPSNGTVFYCSDCLANSNPCSGASTGAFAKRLNGVWDCR
jgi:hypothetical protein